MIRKIIQIDSDACTGCGTCAKSCHEGAIAIVDGKASLLRDDFCDGLGDCLPLCPAGAISLVQREAPQFDASALAIHRGKAIPFTCPSRQSAAVRHPYRSSQTRSALRQWPVQIKRISTDSHYFQCAHLLVAADCAAYAYADFHETLLAGKTLLIGCPKLDNMDYVHKLTEIIALNSILSVTLVRMETSCCDSFEPALQRAVKNSAKLIPYHVVTVTCEGALID